MIPVISESIIVKRDDYKECFNNSMFRLHVTWLNSLLFVIVILLASAYFLINQPLGSTHLLVTAWDEHLPFIPVFIVPYLLFIPIFWLIIIYAYLTDYHFKTLALALILVYLISYGIYMVFQTYIPRPTVLGQDIFSQLVRIVYADDKPFNAYPSLHAATAALLVTYLTIFSRKLRWPLIMFGVLVILSTLFVKQHVIADAFSGMVLGITVTYGSFFLLSR